MPMLDFDEKTSEQLARQANNIMIGSAISILFCCLGGVVATYIAHNAKYDALAGDFDAAKKRIGWATALMIATYLLGIMAFIGNLIGPR